MAIVKDIAGELIDQLPNDATREGILYTLLFWQQAEAGLEDVAALTKGPSMTNTSTLDTHAVPASTHARTISDFSFSNITG